VKSELIILNSECKVAFKTKMSIYEKEIDERKWFRTKLKN
jgi:hypothetical protein